MNGVFSAIPYAIQSLVVFIASPLADFLRAKYLSTTITRKIFTCTCKYNVYSDTSLDYKIKFYET